MKQEKNVKSNKENKKVGEKTAVLKEPKKQKKTKVDGVKNKTNKKVTKNAPKEKTNDLTVEKKPVIKKEKATKKIKPVVEDKKVTKKPAKAQKKPSKAKKKENNVEKQEVVEQQPSNQEPIKQEESNPEVKEAPKNNKKTNKKPKNNKKVDILLEDLESDEPAPTMVIKHYESSFNGSSGRFKLLIVVNLVLIIALVTVGLLYFRGDEKKHYSNYIEREVLSKLPEEADTTYQDLYNEFYEKAYVKDDYIGQIVFESGIINEPVMQGDTNETYLRRNFETYKYEICGPVFMDYICDVETDQNLILYGHNRSTGVDPEHVMMFSPLHVLEKEENYEANKIIYMVYADRVDVYLVASVYPIKVVEKEDGNQYLVKGEPLYYLNNYGVEEFETYIEGVKMKQLYDTGIKLVNTDKLLTLQTCYEDKLDKLIILAKRIETLYYKKG